MRIAIVGCGYVADYYMGTLANYPQLHVAGVMDRDEERAVRFAKYYGLPCYVSLQEALDDEGVDLVLNLTNPGSHYEITRASLEAGKHVYTEKPLAMSFDEAQELVGLAKERGLQLACAPCSILGETAQTIWRALREQQIGKVRLVFAELSGGPVHLTHPEQWRSVSGTPWPYQDEFQVGATLEHAAYYLSWLVTFFGPATSVTSFATCLVPDKGVPLEHVAPDLTVACIEFASGVVARLTCDIFAPSDHSLRIIGDGGVLSIKDCWDYGSPVYIRQRTAGRADQILARAKAVARRSPRETEPSIPRWPSVWSGTTRWPGCPAWDPDATHWCAFPTSSRPPARARWTMRAASWRWSRRWPSIALAGCHLPTRCTLTRSCLPSRTRRTSAAHIALLRRSSRWFPCHGPPASDVSRVLLLTSTRSSPR